MKRVGTVTLQPSWCAQEEGKVEKENCPNLDYLPAKDPPQQEMNLRRYPAGNPPECAVATK